MMPAETWTLNKATVGLLSDCRQILSEILANVSEFIRLNFQQNLG